MTVAMPLDLNINQWRLEATEKFRCRPRSIVVLLQQKRKKKNSNSTNESIFPNCQNPILRYKTTDTRKIVDLKYVNVTRNNWLSQSLGNKMTKSLERTITR